MLGRVIERSRVLFPEGGCLTFNLHDEIGLIAFRIGEKTTVSVDVEGLEIIHDIEILRE